MRSIVHAMGVLAISFSSSACGVPPDDPSRVAPPTFSLPAGEIAPQDIRIVTATEGATIRFTIDGSDPSDPSVTPMEGGAGTSSAFAQVLSDTTVRAYAVHDELAPSIVVSAEYTIDPFALAPPIFEPPGGPFVQCPVEAYLRTTTPDVEVRYTMGDGTQPAPTATTGEIYSIPPLSLYSDAVVKAIAVSRFSGRESAVVTADYRLAVHRVTTFECSRTSSIVGGDAALVGGRLYMLSPEVLCILDVSDPGAPDELGVLEGLYGADAIAIDGSYAFVTTNDGMHVVSIADPSAPAIVATLPSVYGTDLEVSGGVAYLASNESGLDVFDVSVPTAPRLVGNHPTTTSVDAVQIAGSFAYAVTRDALEILDIGDPTSPTLAGSFGATAVLTDVHIEGTLAFVSSEDGLFVVDVSSPAAPSLVARHDLMWGSRITGQGAHVYLLADGVQMFDVSDPSAPIEVGRFGDPFSAFFQEAIVDGSTLYLTESRLTVLSVPSDAP